MAIPFAPRHHCYTHTQKKQHEEWKKKQQQKETLCACKVFGVLCKKCRSFEFMILMHTTTLRCRATWIAALFIWLPTDLHLHHTTPHLPSHHTTILNSCVNVDERELQSCSTIPFGLCAALLQPRLAWKLIWKLLYSLQISRSRSMRIKMWYYPARWTSISAGNCTRWTGSRAMIASPQCCSEIAMWRAWTMNLRIGKWEPKSSLWVCLNLSILFHSKE